MVILMVDLLSVQHYIVPIREKHGSTFCEQDVSPCSYMSPPSPGGAHPIVDAEHLKLPPWSVRNLPVAFDMARLKTMVS